jgi:UDP-GlcNAc3NAcA epimerase
VKVVTVVGNRPQFVKSAPLSFALRSTGLDEVVIHTGQHYDRELSSVFYDELGIPEPLYRLDLHTADPVVMEERIRPVLERERPDVVLVYGDTNSTLAGALAAAQAGVPVAHVEAGMRSYDRAMPEELNRVLTDHAASLLLCSSPAAADTLRSEQAVGEVVVVGDVMVDVFALLAPRADGAMPARLGVECGNYLLATAHRAGNVDDPRRLRALVELLRGVPGPVVLPLHPRTRARLDAAELALDGVVVAPPLGYMEFMALLLGARAVLTDSGGVQKEAYLAGKPCVTLRATTEWRETVAAGWNTLVDLDLAAARAALEREPPATRPPLYGDGQAGARVVEALLRIAP